MNQDIRFDGKVAVVTGAGRGLGREYALGLARRGAAVLVNDAGVAVDASGGSDAVAAAVVEEIAAEGGSAVANSINLRAPGSATTVVDRAVEAFGRVDIVVNNAGVVGPAKGLADCSDEEIAAVLDTNLGAASNLNRAAWPVMVRQQYGRIVNISSHSIFGVPHAAPYIIARSANIGLTTALASEGEAHGIKVNAILPAAYTRMTSAIPNEDFRALLENLLPPETVVPIVLLLASDRVPCSGWLFGAGGGFVNRVALAVGAGAAGITTAEQALEQFEAIADLSAPSFPLSIPEVMAHHVTGVMRADYDGAALDFFG